MAQEDDMPQNKDLFLWLLIILTNAYEKNNL